MELSHGDISLAVPTKFRRFKRPERRLLLDALEAIPATTEDMLRRPEVWKRLGRELRPGDYAKHYPKTLKAFDFVRNDLPFSTFNSRVEDGLRRGDLYTAADLLNSRPGDFARRLDHMLRLKDDDKLAWKVVEEFLGVASKVSTPVLLQVYAHFLNRDKANGYRTFFPKGNVSKVQVVEEILPPLPSTDMARQVAYAVREKLVTRFRSLPPLGRVYIDERLRTQFVPFAQRSASKALRTITRGSRLPLPDCKVLRFFCWWKDGESRTDIDLAAVFLDTNLKRLAEVTYYNLKAYDCAHSGDITSAPKGACEFIDANIDSLQQKGVRYVLMAIYSYTQQAFKDLPECFAGWMARTKVQSGEVFEARTVQDKIDIAGDTTVNIPLMIDLDERQVIWADLALKNRNAINNSHSNRDSLVLMARAVVGLVKPTLYDLFEMHAEARAKDLVASREEADTVFSMHEGITPFDADKIMSEFLPNASTLTLS